IREIGQLPTPPRDQQFIRAGALLVVRSYYEALDGQLPDWLHTSTAPNHSGPCPMPSLAHVLFRLQRFGIAAPRLIAVAGDGVVHVEPLTTTPLSEALAKADTVARARMLRDAGRIVRRIHDAGYRLPAGESWEHRLAVRKGTHEIVLARA